MKINFEQISNINVDCVIGFGDGCRVAGNLKKNNLRFFSTPFDWQMNYSLETVFNLLKEHGKNFFKNYKLDFKYNKHNNLGLIDTITGMISIHDFYNFLPTKINEIIFKYKYRRRFNRLDKILKDAQNICIVTNRPIKTKEILYFIEKFLQLYTFKNLYYVNIYENNSKSDYEKLIKTELNNITILEYYFNDNNNTNSDDYLGNIEYWTKILSKITLNKKFLRKYISYRMLIIKKFKIFIEKIFD